MPKRKELIDSIVSRITNGNDNDWGMNIDHFDWGPGVGLYGIYRAWKYTGEQRYFDYLENWIKVHLVKAYSVKTVNSAAPLLTLICMYEDSGKQDYLKVCCDIADYIINDAPRTREGGLEHTVTERVDGFREQLWADTLFMVCIFLARLGRITGNAEYTNMAAEQLAIHHRVLKDYKTGLFYHGWNCESKDWMSAVRWARANAWITVSTVEMLEKLPEDFTDRSFVISSLLEQVKGLGKVQKENGMFGTVLDYADAYGETSATAGIAYGIKRGIISGYIPEEYLEIARKAEKAVIERINSRGEVQEVSYGTPIMKSAEEYMDIPNHQPTLYGQALALLLLCE